MRVLRPIVSVVTAIAFFLQATGLAYALPPQGDVQPVPYNPSQPVPVPAQPSYAPPPGRAPGAAPPPAYAPTAVGGDSIYLKGGGMMRGTLVEMLPNDHATLQLPTGQNAIIEWGKIDHIERAAPGIAAPPAAGVYAPAPRRRVLVEGASVLVHLEAEPGVVLESISPGSGRWALVCAAPCDVQIPLGRQYRIGGEGIRPSRPFGIEAPPGQRITILASEASRGAFAGGIALTSLGSAGIVVGLVVILIGAVGACDTTDIAGDCVGSVNGGLETAGVVILLAGVAMAVGGAILAASNARSKAVVTVGSLFPQTPARPETAWLRGPTWHDASTSAAPKMTGLPLFTQRF